MEKPIQILHDVNPKLHYDARQLDAINEMAFRFAAKVLEHFTNDKEQFLTSELDFGFTEIGANEYVTKNVPGRGETYKPDDENPGLLPDEK